MEAAAGRVAEGQRHRWHSNVANMSPLLDQRAPGTGSSLVKERGIAEQTSRSSRVMTLAGLLRRLFVPIVMGLLAMAIYLQASGVTQLAAERMLAVAADRPRKVITQRLPRPLGPRETPTTGDPILNRNPFDSATGPVDRHPVIVAPAPPPAKVVDMSDPLGAPACSSDLSLQIVMESAERHASSWASVHSAEKGTASKLGVGDQIGDLRVVHIGYNRRLLSPAVWFASETQFCQISLFARAALTRAAPAAPGLAAATPAAPDRAAAPPPAQVTAKAPPARATAVPAPADERVDRQEVEALMEAGEPLTEEQKVAARLSGRSL